MKKRYDPLWEIVGEKVRLQGSEDAWKITCPKCHVPVELPGFVKLGQQFTCGLCGGKSEVTDALSVADDGSTEISAHLTE